MCVCVLRASKRSLERAASSFLAGAPHSQVRLRVAFLTTTARALFEAAEAEAGMGETAPSSGSRGGSHSQLRAPRELYACLRRAYITRTSIVCSAHLTLPTRPSRLPRAPARPIRGARE